MYVRVCLCVCVCACVRVSVRVCVCACVRVFCVPEWQKLNKYKLSCQIMLVALLELLYSVFSLNTLLEAGCQDKTP